MDSRLGINCHSYVGIIIETFFYSSAYQHAGYESALLFVYAFFFGLVLFILRVQFQFWFCGFDTLSVKLLLCYGENIMA